MAPAAAAPWVQLDQDQLEQVREQAQQIREQSREQIEEARAQAEIYREQMRGDLQARGIGQGIGWGVAGGIRAGIEGGLALNVPLALQPRVAAYAGRGGSDDQLYNAGLRALDNYNYDVALEDFSAVAGRGGNRADGALFWKAYSLNKLGKSSEALAAIAELRKSYASSRWLDDAKALEVQVKQDSGRPVSPESQTDEEVKLMALNGIMQSDPDRAIPLVENILKGSGSPKLRARALYVLAISSQPKAQQIVEQVARGGGNPDLQVKAIEYLNQRRRQNGGSNQNQLLMEIYNSSNDLSVKRAVISALQNSRDTAALAQLAKTEKNPDLRQMTFGQLGEINGQPELWQIYQGETNPDMKIAILRQMHRNGNADKLAEVARTDKDPKVQRAAIDALASHETANTGDLLVSIYNSTQDQQLKNSIIDRLSDQRTAKYLVLIARAEKDSRMKLRIVERLSNMHSKEAQDYLAEILQSK